ncbi:hypothetical protein DL762_003566 [Monosporascus cannonballus]|uniref:Uncharacterized protein n=1 Tax=Monosporascus cannonballus TaxID=155416 RepID=A0ABY0HBF2_9PEZI|nr:hypothetical protein DL762_003566 [Monosporascus cannonballus]
MGSARTTHPASGDALALMLAILLSRCLFHCDPDGLEDSQYVIELYMGSGTRRILTDYHAMISGICMEYRRIRGRDRGRFAFERMRKNEVEFIEPTTGALADGFMLEYQSAPTFYEPNISKTRLRAGRGRSRPDVRVQRQGDWGSGTRDGGGEEGVDEAALGEGAQGRCRQRGRKTNGNTRRQLRRKRIRHAQGPDYEPSGETEKATPSKAPSKFRSKSAAKKAASVAGTSGPTYSPAGVIGGKKIGSGTNEPKWTKEGLAMISANYREA